MNEERIRKLDVAWDVYREWLESEARRWEELSFAEWLHIKYEEARREP